MSEEGAKVLSRIVKSAPNGSILAGMSTDSDKDGVRITALTQDGVLSEVITHREAGELGRFFAQVADTVEQMKRGNG